MNEPDKPKQPGKSDDNAYMSPTRQCPSCGSLWDSSVGTCPDDGTTLASPIETDPTFSKYEFLGVIGIGGMGVVYKARQTILDTVVAIKMLHPRLLSADAIRRFQIEGKSARMLQHPHIIKVHDLGVCATGPYMILEYLIGRTVAQVLQVEGPLSLERFLRIYIQVSDALEHAHSRGVLHRDLKPSNIMLTRNFNNEEEIRILDFGIAKLIDDSNNVSAADKLTRTGEAIGSPAYMSPEQAQGAKVDARSDLYSLGCVMYESLTGAPPFAKSTTLETIMAHLSEEPLTLNQAMLGTTKFNQDLETIVARLLKKDPDLRYQSMKELKDHLLAVRDGSGLGRFVYKDQNPSKQKTLLIWVATVALIVMPLVLYIIAPSFNSANQKPSEVGTSPPGEHLREIALPPLPIEVAVDNNVTDMKIGGEGFTTDSDLAPLQRATAVVTISLRKAAISGDGLKYLKNVHTLKWLVLSRSSVHNLEHLSDVHSLERLDLDSTEIGDPQLEPLRNLNLTAIDLSGTSVRTLNALKSMQTLKEIRLVGANHIGSSAMAVIGGLKKLERLDLNATPITDTDLKILTHLPKLQNVALYLCPNLTDKAVSNLKKQLPPDCVVGYEFGHPSYARHPLEHEPKPAVPPATARASADISAKMAKAERLSENQHWQEAIALYKLALKSCEAEPANRWDDIAYCYSQLGRCQFGLHEKEESLQSYKKEIAVREAHPELKSRSDLPDAYCHLATLYDNTQRIQQGIQMHKRADELFTSMRSTALANDPNQDKQAVSHSWDMRQAQNLLNLYSVYQSTKPTAETDRLCRPILERTLYIWNSDPAGKSVNAGYYHHALAKLYLHQAQRSFTTSQKLSEYKDAMEQFQQTLNIYANLTQDRAIAKGDALIVHAEIAAIELEWKHYDKAEAIYKQLLSCSNKRLRKYALTKLIAICLVQHRDAEAKVYQSELATLPKN